MIILEKPNFPPYICISCGMGAGRKWFVSLDLPLDNYFNPVNAGNVFYCNECWESLATSVAKEAQRFLIGQDPWEGSDYIAPEYENTSAELLKEVSFGPGTTYSGSTEYYSSTKRGNTAVKSNDPESEPSTDNSETDPVRQFRVVFGDSGTDSGDVPGPDRVPGGNDLSETEVSPEEGEENEGEEQSDEE